MDSKKNNKQDCKLYRNAFLPTYQSINQSVNQSINQSTEGLIIITKILFKLPRISNDDFSNKTHTQNH